MVRMTSELAKRRIFTIDYLDLLLVIIISLLAIGVVLALPSNTVLRVLFGIPFLIFCPGYALVSFLWPKKEGIVILERLALSLGLSIVVLIIIGIGLNFTPGGISQTQIMISISISNIIFCLLSWIVKNTVPSNNRYSLSLLVKKDKGFGLSGPMKDLLIAIFLISIFIISIYIVMMIRAPEPFTEFYILNNEGKAERYPKELTADQNGQIIIGIANHEKATMNYNVSINIYNESNVLIGNSNYLVTLNNTEIHEFEYLFNPSQSGKYRIQFILYIKDNTTPKQELHLNNIIVQD